MRATIAVISLVIFGCAGFCTDISKIAQSADLNLSLLRIGLSPTVLEADVNTDDALAATKVWASRIGGASWKNAESMMIPDVETAEELLGKSLVDIIAIGSHEYIQNEKRLSAKPSMAYVHNGDVTVEYVLLVRNDSRIEAAKDLDGKRIALHNRGRHCLAPFWLDVYLMKNSTAGKEISLRERKLVAKTNQAILPVFFGQIDAGIVVRAAFDTAVALNPQMGKQLRVLATSPPMVPLIVCLRDSMNKGQKSLLLDRAMKLHETAGGLQTFTVFKMDRIVAWQKSYEMNTRQLMEEYDKLKRTIQ
jgi:phosphonate transport system substrate-binding protein